MDDITVTPTYIPDLVNNCLDLLIDKERGIWHMSNSTPVSWAEFAQMACETAGVATDRLHPCPVAQTAHFARRPAYSALSSERACLLPPLDDALERYAIARQDHRIHVQAQYGGI